MNCITKFFENRRMNKLVPIYESKDVQFITLREYNKLNGTTYDGKGVIGRRRDYVDELYKQLERANPSIGINFNIDYTQKYECRGCGHKWAVHGCAGGKFVPTKHHIIYIAGSNPVTPAHREYYRDLDTCYYECPVCHKKDITEFNVLKDDIINYNVE